MNSDLQKPSKGRVVLYVGRDSVAYTAAVVGVHKSDDTIAVVFFPPAANGPPYVSVDPRYPEGQLIIGTAALVLYAEDVPWADEALHTPHSWHWPPRVS